MADGNLPTNSFPKIFKPIDGKPGKGGEDGGEDGSIMGGGDGQLMSLICSAIIVLTLLLLILFIMDYMKHTKNCPPPVPAEKKAGFQMLMIPDRQLFKLNEVLIPPEEQRNQFLKNKYPTYINLKDKMFNTMCMDRLAIDMVNQDETYRPVYSEQSLRDVLATS